MEDEFVSSGYWIVRQAFEADVASRCRREVWKYMESEHGIIETEPESWRRAPQGRLGIAEMFQGDVWDACWTEKLRTAIDTLCGAGRWKPVKGCGWWVVTFPGVNVGPWGAEGKWHVDGHGYKHTAQSREVGLVLIFLFSDIVRNGGGTALAPGSHRTVADILLQAGNRGLFGPELSKKAAQNHDTKENVVEITGQAGDVVLCHPFLLHARSKNLGSTIRFMCHPAIPLYEPLRLCPEDDPTPVERVAIDLVKKKLREGPSVEVVGASPNSYDDAMMGAAAMGFSRFGKRRRKG